MKMLTGRDKSMIGMVHLQALPGTPRSKFGPVDIEEIAVREAKQLAEAGFDALLIENMHDAPYLNREVGPEITAIMAVVARRIVLETQLPLGVQILAGANRQALAVALASGARFIRAEGFVFGHVADEGLMQSDAGELLRYRRAIQADRVMVFTDIKKKHSSHAITADVSLGETAHAAEFFGAHGVVVTGAFTGDEANLDDLKAVARASHLPRLVGSGIAHGNLERYWPLADGFIVGSAIKERGQWDRPLDPVACRRLIEVANRLRESNS
ncbi:BtpA/SgcQ family protein [bacterium]|nr:BtpA/SgcQ family protein [bacterium]